MCGIVGIVSYKVPVNILEIKKMTDEIIHRGPDGEGQWLNDTANVGLGHRRLSIIDLSKAGSQPMHYSNKRYTITYNGEIYNYIEIKNKLLKLGYSFKSNTDTEVLLALYDLKKEKALNDIEGMFSFAIWDEKERKLFCARDRFGEKPFFYINDNENFIFASEIKAILKIKNISVNSSKITSFLSGERIISDDNTFFKGVKELKPAHFLIISNANIVIKNYWNIDLEKKILLKNDEEYFQNFKTLFQESINHRLRSDVTIGASLSGGLDSSSIVSVIKNNNKELYFNTYTARFKNNNFDEYKWVKEVENKYSIEYNEIFVEKEDVLENLDTIIWHHEVPVASTSIFAQYKVMELAKNNSTSILLDGQGADEYLAGYSQYKYYRMNELFNKFRLKEFFYEKAKYKELYNEKMKLGYLFMLDPLLNRIKLKRKIYNRGSSLKEVLLFDINNILPELLLYADRNSMKFSREVRLPFLSHKLVEFVFAIPEKYIYNAAINKYILRKSLKNIVPDKIINRTDKLGYAPPEKEWLGSKYFMEIIEESKNKLTENNYTISNNNWRNIVVARFLNIFE